MELVDANHKSNEHETGTREWLVSLPDLAERRPVLEDMSVVIPTLGRPILASCLAWILRGSAWPRQVIVVDQSADDQMSSLIGHARGLGLDVRHLWSCQRGRAVGVNRGLEQAETCFVAITDDDCFVDEEWLARMAAHLREHPDIVVTGRVEAAGEGVAVTVTSDKANVLRRPRLSFDSLSGGNMGVARAVVDRVGLFDEDPRLRTAEDGEWAYRALRAQVPIMYAPDVCVWHYGWRDEGSRASQYASYARSHGGFYGKYLRKGDWFIAARVMVHHVRVLRRWIMGTLAGDSERATQAWAYLTGLTPGILAGLRSKEER